jgi:class II lanthipeptide synthase
VIDNRELIARALAATNVVSPTTFTWFGARSPELAHEVAVAMSEGSARAYLVYNLRDQLYADFYCAGEPRPRLDLPALDSLPGTSPFIQRLSEANAGTFAREPGWAFVRETDGVVVVTRNGLSLWAHPAEVYPVANASLSPGAAVGVLMPKELLRLSPGFYMALGEAEFPVDGSEPLVRFYWNLRPEGAEALIGMLTQRLNGASIAFRLKVVSEPARYSRCDAGVLYALQEQYDAVAKIVSEVYTSLAPVLKPATPALTKWLAPGLGLAEDPAGSLTSFGMSRCQLLAEAIARAAEAGAQAPHQRLAAVEQRFAEAGIGFDAPYLNAGSSDRYTFELR